MAYAYYRNITIDNTKIDAALTDYPAMVKLDDTNFDFTKIRSDGYDLIFTNNDGTVQLKHEVELFSKGETYNKATYDFSVISSMPSEFTNNNLETYEIANNQLTLGDTYDSSTVDSYCSIPTSLEGSFDVNIDFNISSLGVEGYLFEHYLSVVTTSGDVYKISYGDYWNPSSPYPRVYCYKNGVKIYDSGDTNPFQSNGVKNFKISREGDTLSFSLNDNTVTTQTESEEITEIRLYTHDLISGYSYENFKIENIEIIGDFDDTLLHQGASLSSEIVGSNKAVYHVKIPSVSSSADTTFRMYYGDSSVSTDQSDKVNVWDSNFVMVQHMGDSLADSTSNGNDGTNYGSTVVDGLNGKARSFDGSNDYINITASASINSANYTYTVLGKLNVALVSQPKDYPMFFFKRGTNTGVALYNAKSAGKLQQSFGSGSGLLYGDYTIDYTTTNHKTYSMKHDGTDGKLYLDGVLKETITSGYSAGATNLAIGTGGTNYLSCTVDEFRVSNTARSDAWIKADDYNLRTYALLSVGTETENGIPVEITGNAIFFGFNF